jgi:hypothetical protein
MKFIDLNRHFMPLNKDQEPSPDIGRFWGARLGGWLNWEELRRHRRVILLAEASSGKTEEFRNQCDVLKAAGNRLCRFNDDVRQLFHGRCVPIAALADYFDQA